MAEDMLNAVFTKEDAVSPTWLRLRAHIERRIQVLRVKNDKAMSPEDTAALRGRIAELKNLLTMDKPSPAIVADEGE